MKIAIIGSGVSGLTSAYLLAPHHDVTVYEKADRIGGHAHTIAIKEGQKEIAVDNGFMVFNPERYPNFVKLIDELGVESIETSMSFGLDIPDQISYNSSIPFGLFANKSNLHNLRFLKFLYNVTRFRKIARQTLANDPQSTATLGEFMTSNDFDKDVANWFLFPTLAAIWSIKDVEKVADFPAIATFRFLDNHKLLNTFQPKWRTIKGGSREYVKKMEKIIVSNGGNIVTKANISSILRRKNTIEITVSNRRQNFERIIFATHADVTKTLLTDITKAEKRALENFSYTNNVTVLHKDTSVISSNRRLLAAWNYTQRYNQATSKLETCFSYCMNILQHIPHETPVFVTLNPTMPIDDAKIYAIEEYSHPQYNLKSLAGQSAISKLQGKRNTFYTGAHLGYGFHEDGVVSAINVVEKLNATP